jgi:hypothetical protein
MAFDDPSRVRERLTIGLSTRAPAPGRFRRVLCEHRGGPATRIGAHRAPYWPVRNPSLKRSRSALIRATMDPCPKRNWTGPLVCEGGPVFFFAWSMGFGREPRGSRPIQKHKAKSRTEAVAAPRTGRTPGTRMERAVLSASGLGRDDRDWVVGSCGSEPLRRPVGPMIIGLIGSDGSVRFVTAGADRVDRAQEGWGTSVARWIRDTPGGPHGSQVRDRPCASRMGEGCH